MQVSHQLHAPADLLPGKDPVPTEYEDGSVPEPVGTGLETLAPAKILTP